jgi:hypothetical protein
VSCGDVVTVTHERGEHYFRKVVTRSGHSTLRVIVFQETDVSWLRGELRKLGCSSELSMLPSLIAVDVPPAVSYEALLAFLEEGVGADRWECEESSVAHQL